MDLSIVVVNWNTRDHLRRCLESIYRSILDLEFEVIVVDNASTDGSVEMISTAYPGVVLVRNERNLGFAQANNRAIEISSGRHVLLLNSDAELLDDSARLMVEYLDGHSEVGIVGGKLLNPDGTFQSSYADFPSLLDELLMLTGLSRWLRPSSHPSYPERSGLEVRAVDWVVGAFLMARRKAIHDVGLLDEAYFMYSEEVDWCYRMKSAGWLVVYLPASRAKHAFAASASRVPERRRAQLYRSKWIFIRKRSGLAQASVFRAAVLGTACAGLTIWTLRKRLAAVEDREVAARQIDSYRYLLVNF